MVIRSVHGTLRILTADQLVIEDPAGQRFTAVVVDRTESRLMLALTDGTILRLTLVSERPLSGPPSPYTLFEQSWILSGPAAGETLVPLKGQPREPRNHAFADERRV